MAHIPSMQLSSSSSLSTVSGTFELLGFTFEGKNQPTVALISRTAHKRALPLVRIQSRCETSEVFGSMHCDCADQLRFSMKAIDSSGFGALIYLDQEARGNGLAAKLKIYELMETQGLSSVEACKVLGIPIDSRAYGEAAAILCWLEMTSVRLLTNNPAKVTAMEQLGISVQQELLPVEPNEYDYKYLIEKEEVFHHVLHMRSRAGGKQPA